MSLRAVPWRSNLLLIGEVLPLSDHKLNGDCFVASFLAITCTLLIKRLLNHVFNGRVGDGDIVAGQVSQKSRRDAGNILRFDLNVLLLPVFLILNGSAIFSQIM